MKCARCDAQATDGPYCEEHAPQTTSFQRGTINTENPLNEETKRKKNLKKEG